MKICTTSKASANLSRLIDHTAKFHYPIYIVGKNNKAVLIGEEDYKTMIEACTSTQRLEGS